MQYLELIKLQLVIENVSPWFSTAVVTITHSLDYFRSRLIYKLIEDISGVLQKLFRYFNGTIISTFFVPLLSVWLVIFSLILIALAAKAGSSRQYCYKIPDVFE